MSKVTVEQFLNAGFEFVAGDKFQDSVCKDEVVTVGIIVSAKVENRASIVDSEIKVISLTPRPNLDTQPVTDDCVVEVTYDSGLIMTNTAGVINWKVSKPSRIVTWKPSLKHLEQQMNKQESTMNISERDIEDASIKQEDSDVERELSENDEWVNGELPPFGLICEVRFRTDGEWTDWFDNAKLKAGYDSKLWFSHSFGDCVHPANDVEFRKSLTPEQLEAKEREDSVDTMLIDAGFRGNVNVNEFMLNNLDSDLNVVFDSMFNLYDAGYRK